MDVNDTLRVPVFLMVIDLAAEVVFVGCLPKAREAALKLTSGSSGVMVTVTSLEVDVL